MVTAVCVQGLTKSFSGRPALADIGFTVDQGEMVALLGASGSGKSTLLRHLVGAVLADRGRVSVFDQEVQVDGRCTRRIRQVRCQVGFVFQQFNLVGRLPVIVNVLVGLLHRMPAWRSLIARFSVGERQEALEALATVGIEQTAWQRSSTLSGGQQQRAALARCLVQGAKIILADEPVASLDPESTRKVMELLKRLNREFGCTILVSLHQVDLAMQYAARTIALKDGRIIFDGRSESLSRATLDEVYGVQDSGVAVPVPDPLLRPVAEPCKAPAQAVAANGPF
jgi:phosphonate transport system ATP-binding protein